MESSALTFIVYGAKGWIAGHLIDLIEKAGDKAVVGSRVKTFDAVLEEVKTVKPDRIICCLGRTSGPGFNTIDYLEGKVKENLDDNLGAPLILAEVSRTCDIAMLYFGTGCVFEYDKDHTQTNFNGFKEEDYPNFFGSSYSTVKARTDTLMRQYPTVLNARIRMPISDAHNQKDFISKIMNYERIVSIPNSMTVLSDILPTLLALLVQKVGGAVNATNPGLACHEEILNAFNHSGYKLIQDSELAGMLDGRRSNNYLDTTRIEKLNQEIPTVIKAKYQVPAKLKHIMERIKELKVVREGTEHRVMTATLKRRILVTGCCGFIGSNFVNAHLARNPLDFIINIDRLDPCSSENHITGYNKERYKFVKCDLNNSDFITFLLSEYRIDIVMHFAAQTHVDVSFTSPKEFTVSNVLGTHSLLEACRQYGKVKRFLHVSTDEVYGEVATGSADENYRLDPTNPYAATKAGAEFMVRAYCHSFQLPTVITRGNNVFGRHQYPDKVIPRFISQIRDGKKITIHGKGEAVRNFIHVDDVSSALDTILNKGVIGETYNIGSSDEVSVMELAQTLIGIMKPGEALEDHIQYVKERPFNDCRYSVSSDKLRSLGWAKNTTFEEGLKETIAWYLSHPDYWTKDAYEYKE